MWDIILLVHCYLKISVHINPMIHIQVWKSYNFWEDIVAISSRPKISMKGAIIGLSDMMYGGNVDYEILIFVIYFIEISNLPIWCFINKPPSFSTKLKFKFSLDIYTYREFDLTAIEYTVGSNLKLNKFQFHVFDSSYCLPLRISLLNYEILAVMKFQYL